MSYFRAYIPGCPAYGWTGGPEFKTRVVELLNGRERRNAMRRQPRHGYTLPFQNISQQQYAQIKSFHLTCMGMLHAFLYQDPLDFTADNAEFAIADGVSTTYQLAKLSVVDGVSYLRNVYAITRSPTNPELPLDLAVTVNGSPVTVTADVDRGTVTFSAPPANGAILRGTYTFDVWVRFNQDSLPWNIDNRRSDGFAVNGSVDLIEVPPPPLEVS